MILNYFSWILLALCFIVAVLYWKQRARLHILSEVPGTPPTFLIGNVFGMVKMYHRGSKLKYHPGVYNTQRIFANAVIHQKAGMYCFWFGIKPLITFFKPELLELLLGNSTSLEKSYEYNFIHKWLGTGLLTSKGRKWKQRRRLLTPSFHFRILEDHLSVFNKQSFLLIQKLKSLLDDEYINIEPLISLCTLDVVCETAMGVSIEAQKGSNLEYVQALHSVGNRFNQRILQPWLWPDFIFDLTNTGKKFNKGVNFIHAFTDEVIRERKKEFVTGANYSEPNSNSENEYYTKRRKNFLDLLLAMHYDGDQLSDEDIREEVNTFMFEGQDTTAMALIFALYCIGLYPEVQKKIAEELDTIFGDDMNRPVTQDDTKNMKYLECVLKESLRLFPSVPIIGRTLNEDLHYDGITIPQNTTIRCNLYSLHRNPDVFPNPEMFEPERFLPENSAKRHTFAYLPFSAGPRNCIGQKFAMLEEKTVVSNILRHFTVTSLDPRDKFHVRMAFTLRPAQEVRMTFLPRY